MEEKTDKAKALLHIAAHGVSDSPDVTNELTHEVLADFDGQIEATIKYFTSRLNAL